MTTRKNAEASNDRKSEHRPEQLLEQAWTKQDAASENNSHQRKLPRMRFLGNLFTAPRSGPFKASQRRFQGLASCTTPFLNQEARPWELPKELPRTRFLGILFSEPRTKVRPRNFVPKLRLQTSSLNFVLIFQKKGTKFGDEV